MTSDDYKPGSGIEELQQSNCNLHPIRFIQYLVLTLKKPVEKARIIIV